MRSCEIVSGVRPRLQWPLRLQNRGSSSRWKARNGSAVAPGDGKLRARVSRLVEIGIDRKRHAPKRARSTHLSTVGHATHDQGR